MMTKTTLGRNTLEQMGDDKFIAYGGVGHGAGGASYTREQFEEWLQAQRDGAAKTIEKIDGILAGVRKQGPPADGFG